MNNYIALFRGINVGGKNKIIMKELQGHFNELGFSNVSTYIQSGNVFFSSNKDMNFSEYLEEQIEKIYGFKVPIIVFKASVYLELFDNNPYTKEDINKLHITFFNTQVIKEIEAPENTEDTFTLFKQAAYIVCEGKYHQSKLSNTFFEKKLQVKATTRNWKTASKISEQFKA